MADDDVDVDALRAQASEASEKLAALEREHAFARAGLPLGERRAQMFMRAYEGELTPEAIKGDWEELFPAAPEEKAVVPREELEAHTRMSAMSAGGGEPDNESFFDLLEKTERPEDVMRLAGRFKLATSWNREDGDVNG